MCCMGLHHPQQEKMFYDSDNDEMSTLSDSDDSNYIYENMDVVMDSISEFKGVIL